MQSAWDNPILLLALTALIWAGHSVVGRLAVGQIAPMTLTTVRWALALGPIMIAARPALRRDWPNLARALAVRGRHGRPRFHGLQRPVLRRRASTGALNMSIIQGAIPALVLIGARVAFWGADNRDAGAGHAGDHDRRRRDRRARRMVAAGDVRFQPGRRHDAPRGGLLRLLHVRACASVPCLRARHARRHGVRGVGDLRPVVGLGGREGRIHLADRPGCSCWSTSRSAQPSWRRSSTCAASN